MSPSAFKSSHPGNDNPGATSTLCQQMAKKQALEIIGQTQIRKHSIAEQQYLLWTRLKERQAPPQEAPAVISTQWSHHKLNIFKKHMPSKIVNQTNFFNITIKNDMWRCAKAGQCNAV